MCGYLTFATFRCRSLTRPCRLPGPAARLTKHEVVKRWTAEIAASDGFVFVTPEYNYGPAAVLKNAIDWVYPEWNRKAAAFVSYGSAMGARSVQQLRGTMIEIQIAPVRSSVHIPVATLWAHSQGGDVDKGLAELEKQANVMIDDLLWWTAALKPARAGQCRFPSLSRRRCEFWEQMPTRCWWSRLSHCGTTLDPTRPRSSLSSMMRSEKNNEGSMETNKQVVLKVLKGAFIERDPTVVDRYFSPDYVQHNPVIPNGPRAIANLIPTLTTLSYEIGMVVAEGDLVMVHGRYVGWGPKPLVAVDIFKVKNGKVVEHWDVMQEEVPASATASGNPMFTPA